MGKKEKMFFGYEFDSKEEVQTVYTHDGEPVSVVNRDDTLYLYCLIKQDAPKTKEIQVYIYPSALILWDFHKRQQKFMGTFYLHGHGHDGRGKVCHIYIGV
jgi:hypothetical protein